jgi:hypothetical protein
MELVIMPSSPKEIRFPASAAEHLERLAPLDRQLLGRTAARLSRALLVFKLDRVVSDSAGVLPLVLLEGKLP